MTTYIIKYENPSCDNFGFEQFKEQYGNYFVTIGDNRYTIQTDNEELENMLTVYDCIEWFNYPNNIEQIMVDMCIKVNANRFAFAQCLNTAYCRREALANIATLKTGHKWNHTVIRGSSQSEWCGIIYQEDKMTQELLEMLSDFFFDEVIEVGVIQDTNKDVSEISCDDIDYLEQIPICKAANNESIKEYLGEIGNVTFLKEKERTVTYYEKEVI